MSVRLLYLVSHPIQYQAPLLRLIAAAPGLALRVLFERVDTADGYFDPGFQRWVKWDVPLREGYDSAALADTDLAREIAAADVLWVHGWQSAPIRRALALAARKGVPVLMRGENWSAAMPDGPGLRGVAKRLYLWSIFRRCRAFLTIGAKNHDYYLEHGIGAERLFPMPYAIDNAAFAAAAAAARPHRAALRRTLGLPEAGRIVLYASKLIRRKHPELLAEAWRRAPWSDGGGPEGERPLLLYVGEGEMLEAVKAAAGPGMHFAGFRNQTELPALYDLADVLVLPAEQEPWGLVVNEAMACGTPVVATDQVGAAFDLVDETCGAMVPANDVDALAAALVRVSADAEALGRAASARIACWSFAEDVDGLQQAVAFAAGR